MVPGFRDVFHSLVEAGFQTLSSTTMNTRIAGNPSTCQKQKGSSSAQKGILTLKNRLPYFRMIDFLWVSKETLKTVSQLVRKWTMKCLMSCTRQRTVVWWPHCMTWKWKQVPLRPEQLNVRTCSCQTKDVKDIRRYSWSTFHWAHLLHGCSYHCCCYFALLSCLRSPGSSVMWYILFSLYKKISKGLWYLIVLFSWITFTDVVFVPPAVCQCEELTFYMTFAVLGHNAGAILLVSRPFVDEHRGVRWACIQDDSILQRQNSPGHSIEC